MTKNSTNLNPEAFLLTVFFKHDQTKNLDEIQKQLDASGFWKNFPPEGIEVASWYVMMGIGHVVTLKVPAAQTARGEHCHRAKCLGRLQHGILHHLRLCSRLAGVSRQGDCRERVRLVRSKANAPSAGYLISPPMVINLSSWFCFTIVPFCIECFG